MKSPTVYILVCLLAGAHHLRGQDTLRDYYPNGQVKECKISVNGRPVQAFKYFEDGKLAYRWDKRSATFESFTGDDFTDTLITMFDTICPDRTVIRHYGQGPLYSVFHGKHNGAYGEMIFYNRNGSISGQGHYSNGRKSGIWTYHYDDGEMERRLYISFASSNDGVSITYTIFPVALLVGGLFLLFFWAYKAGRYYLFYKTVCVFTCVVFFSVFLLGNLIVNAPEGRFSFFMQHYFLTMLYTLMILMILLSIVNITIANRLRIKKSLSVIYLIAGIVLLFVLLLLSNIAGAGAGVM